MSTRSNLGAARENPNETEMAFMHQYKERTRRSRKLSARAARTAPLGVQNGFRFFEPYPLYIKNGSGSKIRDVDDNEYIDYCMGMGPFILGHSHPSVVQAVKSHLDIGSLLIPSNEYEIQLCEKLVRHVPGVDMVRLTCSGTEATLYTIRLARAFTKRSKIIMFEGGYHGHHDYVMVSTQAPWTASFPASAGILPCAVENTLVLPFNNIDALEKTLAENGNDVAAVIVEPYMRSWGPRNGFLPKLRKLTRKHGIVLILDEVVTGFRLALGGGSQFYGISGDLVALGKIIGGGMGPVGAFGGRREIMDFLSSTRKGEQVFHAGTFIGSLVTVIAGLSTIGLLERQGTYARLNAMSKQLVDSLRDAVQEVGIEVQITGEGSIWDVFFTSQEIHDYRSAAASDAKKRLNLFRKLLLRGIFVAKNGHNFMSTAHTTEDIENTVKEFKTALKEIHSS